MNPYSTTITEIDLDSHRSEHDAVRLVVVEQDVWIPYAEIDLVYWFTDLAGMTNWETNADYHYADRGGLVINLPNVSSSRLRGDVVWGLEQGCKRLGYKPRFMLPFGENEHVNFGGRHVNIAVLNSDCNGYDKSSPQERLATHLQLHRGIFTRRPDFPLLTQLESGTGYVWYGGRSDQTQMVIEIVIVTDAGTRAFQLDIVDEEARALEMSMVEY